MIKTNEMHMESHSLHAQYHDILFLFVKCEIVEQKLAHNDITHVLFNSFIKVLPFPERITRAHVYTHHHPETNNNILIIFLSPSIFHFKHRTTTGEKKELRALTTQL